MLQQVDPLSADVEYILHITVTSLVAVVAPGPGITNPIKVYSFVI